MPKRKLIKEQALLESRMIQTMIAGLKKYRPDLGYPESVSDMQACVRGLMEMFDIKDSPLPNGLKYSCGTCKEAKTIPASFHNDNSPSHLVSCPNCKGKGYEI